MKNKLGKIIGTATVLAAGYKIAKSTGLIDKVVYKKEYESCKKYIDAHYPHSKFTSLEKTDTGFVCIVTTPENQQIILTMTKANEGIYIFSEQKI